MSDSLPSQGLRHARLPCPLLSSESESEVAQSCLTLCDPMDCSLTGSSVHEIFQERVLEWIAISFSRRSSWPRNRTRVSCIAGRRFTVWATREAKSCANSCPLSPWCRPAPAWSYKIRAKMPALPVIVRVIW